MRAKFVNYTLHFDLFCVSILFIVTLSLIFVVLFVFFVGFLFCEYESSIFCYESLLKPSWFFLVCVHLVC